MSADEGGFLARWARRKADARRGGERSSAPPVPPTIPASPPATAAALAPASLPTAATAESPATQAHAASAPQSVEPAPPPPTLADVAALTRDSDYTRFVAADVAPGVRNAAMKKLFSDSATRAST